MTSFLSGVTEFPACDTSCDSAHPVSSHHVVKMHTQIHKMGSILSFSLDAAGLTQSERESLDQI